MALLPNYKTPSHIRNRCVASALAVACGLAGGAFIAIALHKPYPHLLLLGGCFGLAFGALLGPLISNPGAGLIWGECAAFLLWLLLPARAMPLWNNGALPANTMLVATRQQLPELVSYLICLGIPLGLVIGIYNSFKAAPDRSPFRWTRPIISGALAGLLSGLVFDHWTLAGGFSPILAGIAGLSSLHEYAVLQTGMTLVLGAFFGLLFQRDMRSLGSSMSWGLGIALTGWFLGPLTLFPLLRGLPLDWSPASVSNQFGALIGQILFGLLLGFTYAGFDRAWVLLFIQSDPLYKKAEGPALHVFRSMFWGAAAGFLGGIVSGPFMFATGVLTAILGTTGHPSVQVATLIHLTVSTLIGTFFGVLFRNEQPSVGLGIAWGGLFGLIWWYAGVLTLLPIALVGSLDWRPKAATMLLPSLIGHLLYGAVSASIFLAFERRLANRLLRAASQQTDPETRPATSPAPALCLFALGLGVLLPMLLA
jgi:hypothetical protein